MRRFFHQGVREGGESLQERLLLGVGQRSERLFERSRPQGEPRTNGRLRRRCKAEDCAAAVGWVLMALQQAVLFELPREG
jgi:hypothetical protein